MVLTPFFSVGAVQLLTTRYVLQTEHLHCLNRLLLSDGCAPGPVENSSKTIEKDRQERNEEDEESEDGEDDGQAKEKRKTRARVRERVMEEWQKLALLQDKESGINANWFEDLCEVEVGRWLEG